MSDAELARRLRASIYESIDVTEEAELKATIAARLEKRDGARLQERERCAKMALDYAEASLNAAKRQELGSRSRKSGYDQSLAAQRIAAAICALPEGE